jgi:hypothetical protein
MKHRLTSASFLLFVGALLVYLANGRAIGAGDTLPARYLPWSLLRQHNFDLDEFPSLYGAEARRVYPVLDGVPYFLRYRDGHYLSFYSPGPAVLALPIYAVPLLAGVSPEVWGSALEKLAAAAIAALSVVFLLWALRPLTGRGWALTIAAVYAFGTSTWSVSSQALWQHGPSQLFLALALFCLVKAMKDERFLPYAGFALSAATVMRATDLAIALAVAGYVLYCRRHLLLRFALWALLPLAGLLVYNLAYFGSPAGAAGNTNAPVWAFFTQIPLLEGLWGTLLSPSRGLFVYSPVLLFAVGGLAWVGLRGPAVLTSLAVGMVAVVLVVAKWFLWWGGHSWGPRLLADITPILCLFLSPVTRWLDRHRLVKAVFVLLAAVSVAAHGLGAFFYDGRWEVVVDIAHSDAPLWSWPDSPLAFYAREAVAPLRRARAPASGGLPTSADAPALLAASYTVTPIASEAVVGEPLRVAVAAKNTGRAVWLSEASVAGAPNHSGAVRLGWRWWSRDNVEVSGGRALLSSDVRPGRVAHFTTSIDCPSRPDDYALVIDLVSETVTWLADQGGTPVRIAVKVLPLDPRRFVSEPVATRGPAPAATISTDRASYRRGDTLHLTLELRNPYRPRQFDGYLAREGPDGTVWFYDGRERPRPATGAWAAWGRALPVPARATGHFTLPLSDLEPGVYRWYIVLTEPRSYRPVAKAVTSFALEP